MFGKINSAQAINPSGVGLGLTICQRLSEKLGGDISVSSEYGIGSTFTFKIKAKIRN